MKGGIPMERKRVMTDAQIRTLRVRSWTAAHKDVIEVLAERPELLAIVKQQISFISKNK
jgi:hypothetical protein